MNLRKIYRDWVPYDWRPGQIWYRLTCWAWYRYTTVKPRYLAHTWADRDVIMAHMMFEILCQFVEDEVSQDQLEWYGEQGQKITVDGVEKYVMDEMNELIRWWREDYRKLHEEVSDILWLEAEKHPPTEDWVTVEDTDLIDWLPKFKTELDQTIHFACLNAMGKLEMNSRKALADRLHRVVTISPFMWS